MQGRALRLDEFSAYVLFENGSTGEERRELNMMSVWTEGDAKPLIFGFFSWGLSQRAIKIAV